MGIKLNDLSVELGKHFNSDVELEPDDRFPMVMSGFVDKSRVKFEKLKLAYTSMEVEFKAIVTYFGEDPNSTKPDEFFSIFKTFTTSFERARLDLKKQKELESKRKKRESVCSLYVTNLLASYFMIKSRLVY